MKHEMIYCKICRRVISGKRGRPNKTGVCSNCQKIKDE